MRLSGLAWVADEVGGHDGRFRAAASKLVRVGFGALPVVHSLGFYLAALVAHKKDDSFRHVRLPIKDAAISEKRAACSSPENFLQIMLVSLMHCQSARSV